MFSLDKLKKLEAARQLQEETERRKKLTEQPSNDKEGKRRKNRRIESIYGRSESELIQASRNRAEEFALESTLAFGTSTAGASAWADQAPSVYTHTFRDRSPEKEIGPPNGHVSGRTYQPRAFYRGGGQLDPRRTATLPRAAAATAPPQGRRAPPPPGGRRRRPPPPEGGGRAAAAAAAEEHALPTASVVDLGGLRGRLRQPPYAGPEYLLRARDKAAELGPPMKYRAKNDMERLCDTLGEVVLNGNGPWHPGVADPDWRPVRKDLWKGGAPRLTTAPSDLRTHSVSAETFARSVNGQGSYGEIEKVRNFYELDGFRHRDRAREIGEEFSATIPESRYIQSKNQKSTRNFQWDAPGHYPAGRQFLKSSAASLSHLGGGSTLGGGGGGGDGFARSVARPPPAAAAALSGRGGLRGSRPLSPSNTA